MKTLSALLSVFLLACLAFGQGPQPGPRPSATATAVWAIMASSLTKAERTQADKMFVAVKPDQRAVMLRGAVNATQNDPAAVKKWSDAKTLDTTQKTLAQKDRTVWSAVLKKWGAPDRKLWAQMLRSVAGKQLTFTGKPTRARPQVAERSAESSK